MCDAFVFGCCAHNLESVVPFEDNIDEEIAEPFKEALKSELRKCLGAWRELSCCLQDRAACPFVQVYIMKYIYIYIYIYISIYIYSIYII